MSNRKPAVFCITTGQYLTVTDTFGGTRFSVAFYSHKVLNPNPRYVPNRSKTRALTVVSCRNLLRQMLARGSATLVPPYSDAWAYVEFLEVTKRPYLLNPLPVDWEITLLKP